MFLIFFLLAVAPLTAQPPAVDLIEPLQDAIRDRREYTGFKLASVIRSDPRENVRAEAAESLLSLAGNSNTQVRLNIIEAIGIIGISSDPLLEFLADALESELLVERYRTVVALSRIQIQTNRAAQLLQAATDDHSLVARRASEALQRIPRFGEQGEVVDKVTNLEWAEKILNATQADAAGTWDLVMLGRALEDEDPRIRFAAAHTLAKLGETGVSPLAAALNHNSVEVRLNALSGLRALEPAGPSAVLAIEQALSDENKAVRLYAALTLSGLPSDRQRILPALIEALEYSEQGIRTRVTAAFEKVPQDVALPYLREGLVHRSPVVRSGSAEVIAKLKPTDQVTISSLKILLKDEFPFVRKKAALALAALGKS